MRQNHANPCLLYWCSGFEDPTYNMENWDSHQQDPKFGELVIGLSTDDNLEGRANNSRSLAHLAVIRKEFADHGLSTVFGFGDDSDQIIEVAIQYKPQTAEKPNGVLGVAVDYSDSTITLNCPTQIADLVKIFSPNNAEIPVTYTPAPTGWSEESRNDSPSMSLDAFRSAVGIFIFLSTIRFDSLNFTSRHCSRTRHHTELDWEDMRHHVACLYTTRQLIYYP